MGCNAHYRATNVKAIVFGGINKFARRKKQMWVSFRLVLTRIILILTGKNNCTMQRLQYLM